MGVVVQMARGTAIITQGEIEALIGLQNQIRNLQKKYDRKAGALLDRLMAGVTVEDGTHTAELEHLREGGARITRINIY